ncbi:DUF7288 family protein [Natronobiforma cellulositropha]|uniref:DUF7288 family protein n=1 Tax=Natronobiforma cellulositropha TaxID=1679076 RepID=UPI0021D59995|nr:hypothetical protein [Natronobiforma cellulositropha]
MQRPDSNRKPNRSTGYDGHERAQAYTLEGFVGAIIVLTAVLFAIQSIVITPTTGGAVDRTVQAQLQQEVSDALVVAENDGQLSHLIRYWSADGGLDGDGGYHNATVPPTQRGNYTSGQFADEAAMATAFGTLLDERFEESGRNYNVELVYRTDDGDDSSSFYLVYQGRPSPNAFTGSQTVALYDGQQLTAPDDDRTLADAEGEYPIPNVDDDRDLYNLVEVRVIVW